jgi:polysaccharide export outer membrane protein
MRLRIAFVMILVLGSTAVSGRQSPTESTEDAAAPTDPGTPLALAPGYTIGLGDVLRVSVWKEPEISGTSQVRSDGKISLPLLNDVQAVGMTPMELAASVTEKLKKYVDDPRVTVIVSQIKPPVIYMVGEVGRHGPMALTPNMTVLQALATSGVSLFANTKKIYVLRTVNGVQQKLRVNYKNLIKGKALNQNIVLNPGDMVVVP